MPARAIIGEVWEGYPATVVARVTGENGADIVKASITAITYTVYDQKTGAVTKTSTALVVADVVFDTLQTDDRWTIDATGYNFRFVVPGAAFPNGGTTHEVAVDFDPSAAGEPNFVIVVECPTKELQSV
jgi:hypothetical protein